MPVITSSALLLLLLVGVPIRSNTYTISDASTFVDFSEQVNRGTAFEGTTVALDADIVFTEELSKQFNPIGSLSGHFIGTFDGQGHTIRNLNLTVSTQKYAGLFGRSMGMTVKNLVIDPSCSVTNTYNIEDTVYVGAIAGECQASLGPCTIENIVNMASVSFAGGSVSGLHIGGITGVGWSLSHKYTVKNCVNYGSVVHAGVVNGLCNAGGIAGLILYGSKYVQNCANYGNIVSGSTAGFLRIGGIAGNEWNETTIIENCVSAGKIVSTGSYTESRIGAFLGISIGINIIKRIENCYWTEDVGCNNSYGRNTSSITMINTYMITSLNTTTMVELNEHVKKDSTLSKWFVLNLTGGKINNISQEVLVVTQSHFPDPIKEGYTFSHWSTAPECGEDSRYNTSTTKDITSVYACYTPRTYVVSFDFGNGTVVNQSMEYGARYNAPELTKTGHSFSWFSEDCGQGYRITNETRISTASDHSIYAHFSINNYTLIFVFDNGTDAEVSILDYNEKIDYPDNVVREGYSFTGWDKDIVTMPAHNINITTQWFINNYTLTFNFENGTDAEVRILDYNSLIAYPEIPKKEGHSFTGWDKDTIFMPSHDLNITAQWNINNYTLTFVFENGTDAEARILGYNSPIVYPEIPKKEGHSFSGWDSNITNMPSYDLNITAQWTVKTATFVEIVFGTKDITKEDAEKLIRGYTDDSFVIERFEVDNETGELRIIIKFTDKEEAERFMRTVDSTETSSIKRAEYVDEPFRSFSANGVACLFSLFVLIV